ncbi:SDR family NAD(P)-dependent oxidoreductase [Pseudomarimonas arenosa]|uniref:SDR family NAD(P)-dependent oxidoreductase n=1 Tax=Pseudomarimonas arenosa TaxID=2774145 RepID=A0AAW3ZL35_9GAMM|nr:SDR family NAD(P)-dependent oxidoreductase [Pseudomarimonas arenosa]MBD8525894.1 SDR family NAD(P)-dependent oxidoreductase [Pseudomarimonas arenosa]
MKTSASMIANNHYPVGEFSSVFDGSEPFLADHIIQGQKILPGMAYLEIARAAVAASAPPGNDAMLVLSDSVFVNALTVKGKRTVTVRVYPGAAAQFGVEVSTEQGVHFQTRVSLQKTSECLTNKGYAPVLDIARLSAAITRPGPSKSAFYQTFRNRGVQLGPSHRGVEEIFLGDPGEGLATIRLPGASARGMVMDAGALDSIIQSGLALVDNPEADVVPFAVLNTLVVGALTDSMIVHIRQRADGMHYVAADEQGNVRVIIEGFQTREIDLNAKQDRLSFYRPVWKNAAPPNVDDIAVQVVEASDDYVATTKALLAAAQSLASDKQTRSALELHVKEHNQAARGLWAALKTVSIEHSQIDVRFKSGGAYMALTHQDADADIGNEFEWHNGSTALISGGLGALGLLVAQDIAERTTGSTLILLSRRAPNEAETVRIEALRAAGANVVHRRCDITRLDEVEKIVAEHCGINLVVHAAGLLDDALLIHKTADAIDRVLAPKLQGIENLDRATAGCPLELFVAFSSVAGALGNAGQFDYAAANGYMDAYIEARSARVRAQQAQGLSLGINWPLWEEGTMQIDDASRQTLARTYAIKPLPSAEGLKALRLALASPHANLLPLYGQKHAHAALFAPPKIAAADLRPQHSSAELDKLQREILQEMRLQAAQHLKMKPNQINESEDWTNFGFDSILISSFVSHLNNVYDLNLMPTAMFEASNLLRFSQFLAENHATQMSRKLGGAKAAAPAAKVPANVPPPAVSAVADGTAVSQFARRFREAYRNQSSYRDEDIAVVGMSCRIAGANNPDEFWRMLDEGRDMISEIPQERWDWRDYPGVSRWGSFVPGIKEFDPLFFGISPAEASYMSPEQRLMMQSVWECIEDAGYGGDTLKGSNTGIYVGAGPSSYTTMMSHLPVEAYSVTGTLSSVGPNRISYYMDWHGPSNPIDTACSSSLVAAHRAIEAIRAGHCDVALVGGVNALLSPDVYISFAKSGMLCEDGRCKTFSDQANGYVRGEGVGTLMLKSLRAAQRDGDDIYAVIKGAAENHGGRTTSLTAPNPNAQAAVILRAIEDAGIDFQRVGYIECHGTGTELGDPVEISGLKAVARELLDADATAEKQIAAPCYLGSIKSNIGHLEYGAGVVGMIKLILQIRHKKIAKSLHCDTISPLIDLKRTPYRIAQQAVDWEVPSGQTRIGGVSSFGFGGVNAHVVIEEYVDPGSGSSAESTDNEQLLVFSARSAETLHATLRAYPEFLARTDRSADTLQRIAHTLQTGRASMQERVAFVVRSIDEFDELLKGFLEEKDDFYHRKVYRGSSKTGSGDKLDIGDTQAGQEFLRRLVETGEIGKIAELWVNGAKLDWQILRR